MRKAPVRGTGRALMVCRDTEGKVMGIDAEDHNVRYRARLPTRRDLETSGQDCSEERHRLFGGNISLVKSD